MQLEPLELRDHRYRAQKALNLLKDESQADERKALEEQIAHYQEICPHEHAEDVEGEWRCKDCDLRKTTAVPEPEEEPEAEVEAAAPEPPAAEAAPAPAPPEAPVAEAAPAAEDAAPEAAIPAAPDKPAAE